MTTGCLEESTVVAFLGGALPPHARSNVEGHITVCTACSELVTLAAVVQASSTGSAAGGRPFVGQLQPGARVGRYLILGALGRGGMGEVYAAYHPDLDRRIALKVVHELGANSGERRARLLREARAIARLSHPNVVTVHDAGTFGDRVFIAMELIDGPTVDEWLRAEPRTWQEVLNVFVAAGHGLAAAHAANVIHRDFKPHNVMIAKDGSVRVMDFGLARLDEEVGGELRDSGANESKVVVGAVTRTGALVGTPAYMSPEQLNRKALDARADQFSFCVALHQALFGSRPAGAVAGVDSSPGQTPKYRPCKNVPGWPRAIALRGASTDREQRYPSMDALIAALERGRDRTRRRVSVLAAAVLAGLLVAGAWRFTHENRVSCVVPHERLAAAWAPGDAADPRRQAIHRAFAATGRATAETSWGRTSTALDKHMRAWTAMYTQACEATHVQGEQSAEVLDLRMSCLGDNLDQVRALTDILATADGAVVARAVKAAVDLSSVSRCADVTSLRSVIPPPRDERTQREVQQLRRALAEAEAMREFGRYGAALEKASALRSRVEATEYKPLLGQLLTLIGYIQGDLHQVGASQTLEPGLTAAVAGHDDETAAKAATALAYAAGLTLGRYEEAERWGRLANAFLDRRGGRDTRIRTWLLHTMASVMAMKGNLAEAKALFEKVIPLKEKALGPDHPDLAYTLDDLGWVLNELGHPEQSIALHDRAISILVNHSDPSNPVIANAYGNKGDSLRKLGRYAEAEQSFARAMEILEGSDDKTPYLATTLSGIGEAKLAQKQPSAAIPYLERAVDTWAQFPGSGSLGADAQFALARALWLCGRERKRARSLATSALKTYRDAKREERERAVEAWLAVPPARQHRREVVE